MAQTVRASLPDLSRAEPRRFEPRSLSDTFYRYRLPREFTFSFFHGISELHSILEKDRISITDYL